MARVYKVVDTDEPRTSGTQCLTTDWKQCILCQEDAVELLKCPEGAGYKTMAENLVAFDKISCLPRTLKLYQE